MSIYVGAYKVPKEKVSRWMDLRRQTKLLETATAVEVKFAEADAIQGEFDAIPEQIYKLAVTDLKKSGFDIRRGDNMYYGFDYLKDDEVMVWMEKGDDDVPDKKSGFGSKA